MGMYEDTSWNSRIILENISLVFKKNCFVESYIIEVLFFFQLKIGVVFSGMTFS